MAAMHLPKIPQVEYLVSWQDSEGVAVPEEIASREDVRVITMPGRGLSRNRNHCLDNAGGDILLIADDDLILYPEGLREVIRIFEENPSLEYGSFRYDSDVPKEYPAESCSLTSLPKNFYQSSVEIALRRDSRAGKLRFNEEFGLGGGKFSAGEEELFLKKARRHHIECRYFPVTIAYHPGETTGVRSRLTDGSIRARGVVTWVEFPWTSVLRIPLISFRIARNRQASFFKALFLMTEGAFHACFSKSLKSYENDCG